MDITLIAAKSIYLANRHPRLTCTQLADRWRHHGSVGGAVDPRIREVAALRYCLTQSPAALLRCVSNEPRAFERVPVSTHSSSASRSARTAAVHLPAASARAS